MGAKHELLEVLKFNANGQSRAVIGRVLPLREPATAPRHWRSEANLAKLN